MSKQLKNLKDGKIVSAQHGEVFLHPITMVSDGRSVTRSKSFTVGHSESGHHHILESNTEFEVLAGDENYDLYLRLFEPAKLVHKKIFDIHETEIIVPGDYAVYTKTEYDPFRDVVRAVYD